MSNVTKYLKSIIPGVLTVVYAVQAAIEDGDMTSTEWRNVGLLALTTFLIYFVPNKPATPPA